MMKRSKRLLGVGLLALAALAVGSAVASAHLLYQNGQFAHQHTSVHWFLNEANSAPDSYSNTRAAQIDWHNKTRRDLSSTSNHDTSYIHVVDRHYGETGWVGIGEYCYHCGHLHTRLNLTYSAGNSQTVACQEIGHNLGEDHHAGDCMGYSYFSDWSPFVGSHSVQDLDSAYASYGH